MTDTIWPSVVNASHGPGLVGRLAHVHRDVALAHQLDRLDHHGAIEAFEAAAGRSDVVPTVGVASFVSDSDVHKWLDAVARSLPAGVAPEIERAFDDLVALLQDAADADGYLNTWVQTLFPAGRFAHLLTEHELYTAGHLIEAGTSLLESTGRRALLDLGLSMLDVIRTALRLDDAAPVNGRPGPRVDTCAQDGHPELELALLRLHRVTGDPDLVDTAAALLDRRGRSSGVIRQSLFDHVGTGRRLLHQRRMIRRYRAAHPTWRPRPRAPMHRVRITPPIALRTVRSVISGRHWQNERPIAERTEPSGHAVGFHHLQTGIAMLAGARGDGALRAVTESAWERELAEHMYVSGGVGAYPGLEGFAEPYDLDPERAYCETCAAISAVIWNRELARLTDDPRYDDLAEWQLLNAAAVAMSTDANLWAYDNPLLVRTGAHRAPWYPISCCPSNLSRLWATTASMAVSLAGGTLSVHQAIAGTTTFDGVTVELSGDAAWTGAVRVRLSGDRRVERLRFRVPSWTDDVTVRVSGADARYRLDPARRAPHSASGLAPDTARWAHVELDGAPDRTSGVEIDLAFTLPIRGLRQDRRVPKVGGMTAIARGPLLYCVEGADHPDHSTEELLSLRLDPSALCTEAADDLFPDAVALAGTDGRGRRVRLIPYFLWGNRAPGPMTAFVRT